MNKMSIINAEIVFIITKIRIYRMFEKSAKKKAKSALT